MEEFEDSFSERIAQLEHEDLKRYQRELELQRRIVRMRTPIQRFEMRVSDYYRRFCYWKEEMISVGYPDDESSYIDDFIGNLEWHIQLRVSNRRSRISRLVDAYYEAQFEETTILLERMVKDLKAANKISEMDDRFPTEIQGDDICDSVDEESVENNQQVEPYVEKLEAIIAEPYAHQLFDDMPRSLSIEQNEENDCVVLGKMSAQVDAAMVFGEMPHPTSINDQGTEDVSDEGSMLDTSVGSEFKIRDSLMEEDNEPRKLLFHTPNGLNEGNVLDEGVVLSLTDLEAVYGSFGDTIVNGTSNSSAKAWLKGAESIIEVLLVQNTMKKDDSSMVDEKPLTFQIDGKNEQLMAPYIRGINSNQLTLFDHGGKNCVVGMSSGIVFRLITEAPETSIAGLQGMDGLLMFIFDPGIDSLTLTGYVPLKSSEMPSSSAFALWFSVVLFYFNLDSCCLFYNGCDYSEFKVDPSTGANKGQLNENIGQRNLYGSMLFPLEVYFVYATSDQASPRLNNGHDESAGNTKVHFTSDMLSQRVPFGDKYCFIDFSHFCMFVSDSPTMTYLISDSIAQRDSLSKSLFEGASSKLLSTLLSRWTVSLDRFTIELGFMSSFESRIGLLSPLKTNFVWDPGQDAISLYITEGKDILLMDSILVIMSSWCNDSDTQYLMNGLVITLLSHLECFRSNSITFQVCRTKSAFIWLRSILQMVVVWCVLNNLIKTSYIEVSLTQPAMLAMLLDLMYLMFKRFIIGICGPVSLIYTSRLSTLPCGSFGHINVYNASCIVFTMHNVYHINASSRKYYSILRIAYYVLMYNLLFDHDDYIGLRSSVSFLVLHKNIEEFNDLLHLIFIICPETEQVGIHCITFLLSNGVIRARIAGSSKKTKGVQSNCIIMEWCVMASMHCLDIINGMDGNVVAFTYHSFEIYLTTVVKSIVFINLKGFVWDPGRDLYGIRIRCKNESLVAIGKYFDITSVLMEVTTSTIFSFVTKVVGFGDSSLEFGGVLLIVLCEKQCRQWYDLLLAFSSTTDSQWLVINEDTTSGHVRNLKSRSGAYNITGAAMSKIFVWDPGVYHFTTLRTRRFLRGMSCHELRSKIRNNTEDASVKINYQLLAVSWFSCDVIAIYVVFYTILVSRLIAHVLRAI